MARLSADVLVIGAGGAGLVAALAAAEAGARVALLEADALGRACNTAVSGGGFLMSTEAFSPQEHVRLTLEAGRFLGDPRLVRLLCEGAPEARRWLEARLGVRFNRKDDGRGYWFTGGGAGFFQALSAAVAREEHVQLWERTRVVRLALEDGRCVGAYARRRDEPLAFAAGAVVLTTGGYAGLYARHDNPGTPVGEGLALALEAGAAVRDLEFVQFYPLGLAEPTLPTFMAFRPFPPGARVIDAAGRSLTERHLDTDDLNEAVGRQRDRLSLVIERARREGPVYLDLTGVDFSQAQRWFSLRFLQRYDFPWPHRPARIAPIAHHTMGGLAIDVRGRTSVPGLYAAGEAAGGLHGANRLGSNSLTACLVFGRQAGRAAAEEARRQPAGELKPEPPGGSALSPDALTRLQRLCWRHLGLEREAAGLHAARAALEDVAPGPARTVAQALAAFALARRESRGAHVRLDYPREDPAQARSLHARLRAGRWVFFSAGT